MRKILSVILFVWLSPLVLLAQGALSFDEYFVDQTLRIDYFHTGDAKNEWFSIDRLYAEGIWAGSKKNLVETFNNGRYYVKIFDAVSKTLIFAKGFDSYFGEYKTTDWALEGIKRTYHESARIPYPKKKILFTLEVRNRQNQLQPIFTQELDPNGYEIMREKTSKDVKVFELVKNGAPHQKVDVAILAEGYTLAEESKMQQDLQKFVAVFFGHEPYKSNKSCFNIYGVFKPSEESGCDEPSHGVFKRTALGVTFDSLGSERYVMTEDNKALRDVAGHVPYDAIYIMVNHSRYGGGGIYNLYCTFTTDNQWYKYLFLHEFGHSFGGLADEYYTSSIAYNEFYPAGIEPVEPNITALLEASDVKWKQFLTPGIAIPTPWEKEEYDANDLAYQKVRQALNAKIAQMKREGAAPDETQKVQDESERVSRENAQRMDEHLAKSKFVGQVGVFEGAGYSSKGLYRPMLDCLMFSKGDKPFCKVCEESVRRVIRYLSE